MNSAGDFFSRRAGEVDDWIQDKGLRYEAKVTKELLRRLGLAGKRPAIEQACYEATGERRLSMAWFHHLYPTFPIRLVAREIPGTHLIRMSEVNFVSVKDGVVKDDFFKSKVAKEYLSAAEEFSSEADIVGMVFPCRTVFHYVMHNGQPSLHRPGSRICKTMLGEEGTAKVYVIEPFRQYLEELGETWQPPL